MIFAIFVTLAALSVLLRLLFGFAVYALPVACGAGAAMLAHASGAGWLGGAIVALIVGTVVLGAGQTLLALARSPIARVAVVSLYALPAAALGFGIAYGLLCIGVDAVFWRVALSQLGAGVSGWVAFLKLDALAPAAEARGGSVGSDVPAHGSVAAQARGSAHPRRRVRDARPVIGSAQRP